MVREGSFPFCCLSLFLLFISFFVSYLFVVFIPFLGALQIDITAVYMYLVF